jgi:putative transposase
MDLIQDAHAAPYGTYGSRRVRADLVLGPAGPDQSRPGWRRLMRSPGLQGVHRRKLRGCTRRDEAATPSDDPVE